MFSECVILYCIIVFTLCSFVIVCFLNQPLGCNIINKVELSWVMPKLASSKHFRLDRAYVIFAGIMRFWKLKSPQECTSLLVTGRKHSGEVGLTKFNQQQDDQQACGVRRRRWLPSRLWPTDCTFRSGYIDTVFTLHSAVLDNLIIIIFVSCRCMLLCHDDTSETDFVPMKWLTDQYSRCDIEMPIENRVTTKFYLPTWLNMLYVSNARRRCVGAETGWPTYATRILATAGQQFCIIRSVRNWRARLSEVSSRSILKSPVIRDSWRLVAAKKACCKRQSRMMHEIVRRM